MSIGANIRTRRLALGWTQSKLAKRTGMSAQQVSDHERDKKGVTLASLRKYAGALEATLDALAREEKP